MVSLILKTRTTIPYPVEEVRVVHEVGVDEESLHGVAGGWVVGLGVPDDLEGLVQVGGAIHVDVADALRVAKDRDQLALLLDRGDKLTRTPEIE